MLLRGDHPLAGGLGSPVLCVCALILDMGRKIRNMTVAAMAGCMVVGAGPAVAKERGATSQSLLAHARQAVNIERRVRRPSPEKCYARRAQTRRRSEAQDVSELRALQVPLAAFNCDLTGTFHAIRNPGLRAVPASPSLVTGCRETACESVCPKSRQG